MVRFAILVWVGVGLTGCVGQRLDEGLQSLVGQNIRAAVARLGYPDGQREMLGDTIYVWSASHTMDLPTASFSTTSGSIGSVPYNGFTSGTTMAPTNLNCRIQLATDRDGTIKRFQYSGNNGGCAYYASALKR